MTPENAKRRLIWHGLFLFLLGLLTGIAVPLFTSSRYLVEQITPTLRMTMMQPEWLESHVKAHPTAIRHEFINDAVLLTTGTQELQQFLVTHLKTAGAFGEPSNLHRAKQDGEKP